MMPLIKAEWMVISRRGATRGLLLISALLPLLVTLVLGAASGSSLEFNGRPINEMVSFSGAQSAMVSLRVRHFFVLPMFILFVTGSSFAAERADHTLRERLVRPVSRDALLGAKLAVLAALCVLSLVINFVMSAGLGSIWMGTDGQWLNAILAHAMSVGTDVGIISLGLLLSMTFRSAAMVVVVGLVLFVFDKVVSMGLGLLGLLGAEGSAMYSDLLPSTGWNVWILPPDGVSWMALLNLLLWTALMAGTARYRLLRMDVP